MTPARPRAPRAVLLASLVLAVGVVPPAVAAAVAVSPTGTPTATTTPTGTASPATSPTATTTPTGTASPATSPTASATASPPAAAVTAPPAAGAVTVHLGSTGPKPAQVTLPAGATLVFVSDERTAGVTHSLVSPDLLGSPLEVTLDPGASTPPRTAVAPGSWTWTGTRLKDGVGKATSTGTVVVEAAPATDPTDPPAPPTDPPAPDRPTEPAAPPATPTGAPTGPATPESPAAPPAAPGPVAPAPVAGPAGTPPPVAAPRSSPPSPGAAGPVAPAPPAPAARAATPGSALSSSPLAVFPGGTGFASAPRLLAGTLPGAPSEQVVPDPQIAPEAGDDAVEPTEPDVAAPTIAVESFTPASRTVGLGQPPGSRPYGLPVTVALVALVGAASLLGRTLLAEPVQVPPGAGPDGR